MIAEHFSHLHKTVVSAFSMTVAVELIFMDSAVGVVVVIFCVVGVIKLWFPACLLRY